MRDIIFFILLFPFDIQSVAQSQSGGLSRFIYADLTLFIFFKSQKTLPKLRLYKKNSKDK
jgi:hypothetical protein